MNQTQLFLKSLKPLKSDFFIKVIVKANLVFNKLFFNIKKKISKFLFLILPKKLERLKKQMLKNYLIVNFLFFCQFLLTKSLFLRELSFVKKII